MKILSAILYIIVVFSCWALIFSAQRAVRKASYDSIEHVHNLYMDDISKGGYTDTVARSVLLYFTRPFPSVRRRLVREFVRLLFLAFCIALMVQGYAHELGLLFSR